MHNGRILVDPGTIANNKFKEQLRMVWCLLVISLINNYEKDMVPFDVRWTMNDVETYAFGTETTVEILTRTNRPKQPLLSETDPNSKTS